MIKLYLFERNVFTAIFFTPLSQQVIRNHISETEKSTKVRFFIKVYTQVGGEMGHSEGKKLGSKGPLRYIQPCPLTRRTLAGQECIYIRFGTKLYRQIFGIPMGTICAPLADDLFLFCCERDFMTSLSDIKQAEIIEAFKSTSRYLDDLLNIDNPYFEGMVNRIYPSELQLNKANTSDTEAPFLAHLSRRLTR